MKKKLNILIFTLWCAGVSIAQIEPPQALYQAIGEYLNDGQSLKRNLRGIGLDTTIQASEVDVGIPMEVYHFKKEFYKSLDINDSIMPLLEPTGSWFFALKARGAYLFEVQFGYKNGVCEWEYTGNRRASWKEIKAAYPENSGINPIIVVHRMNRYLYFPKVNNHNLTLITDSRHRELLMKQKNDLSDINKWGKVNNERKEQQNNQLLDINEMLSITTDSYYQLIDSKKTLMYLKNSYERRKNMPSNREVANENDTKQIDFISNLNIIHI